MQARVPTIVLAVALAARAAAAAEPATPPAPVANALVATAARARLAPLFAFERGPAALRIAKDVTLGMPLAEARRRTPELFGPTPHQPAGFYDVRVRGRADDHGRLGSFVIQLGCLTAVRDVMDLWGVPTWGYDTREKAKLYWWHFPQSGVRATLMTPDTKEGCQVGIERYTPLATILGEGDARFGFEREPLLGMGEADVARVYGDFLGPEYTRPCETQILEMPPVEHQATSTVIRLFCSDDRVVGYELIFYWENKFSLKDDILAGLQRKLGPGTPGKGIMGRPIIDFRGRHLAVQFEPEEPLQKAVVHVRARRD